VGHYAQLTGNIPINLSMIIFGLEKNEIYFRRLMKFNGVDLCFASGLKEE